METLRIDAKGNGHVDRMDRVLNSGTVRCALDRISILPLNEHPTPPANTIGRLVFADNSEAWAVCPAPDAVVRAIWPLGL